MKEESIKTNFIYTVVVQLLGIFIPFITIPYISRVLGAERIGEASYASSIVSYFSIICAFGTSTLGQRKIAAAKDIKAERSKVFWDIVILRACLCVATVAAYLVYVSLTTRNTSIALIYVIHILNVPIDITWFFFGTEQFKKYTIFSLAVRTVSLLLTFLFVRSSKDLWKYIFIVEFDILVGNIVLWFIAKREIQLVNSVNPFHNLKDAFLLFIPAIAGQVYLVLDKSMIGWITNSNSANGYYEQAERIVRMAVLIVNALSMVVMPRVSHLFKTGDIDVAKGYIYKAYRATLLMAFPMVFGIISVSSMFIPLFLGNGYSDVVLLVQIFSFLIIFVGLAHITGISYLVSTEQQNVYTFSVIVSAIINFVLNIFLIRKYSVYGAAIASVFAECAGCVCQLTYCVSKNQLDIRRIFVSTWKYILASIIMFLVVVFAKPYVANNWTGLLLLILLGIFTYIIFLIILRDTFLWDQLKNMTNKRNG